jgi:hypothetical protein
LHQIKSGKPGSDPDPDGGEKVGDSELAPIIVVFAHWFDAFSRAR